jgi:ABC-type multidrug transport system permease subunit
MEGYMRLENYVDLLLEIVLIAAVGAIIVMIIIVMIIIVFNIIHFTVGVLNDSLL